MKPLVILTGPTAVGKTDLSIRLAKKINGDIISADSMQVYRKMDIGTAKITKEEMSGIKHYLIDILEPEEEFNVVMFQKMAKEAMEQIYSAGKIPIIVGGTGFYIQSVLYDIDFNEVQSENEYRKELNDIAQKEGNEYLHNMLKEVDKEAAQQIHCNNVKRVIRALEFYKQTGKKISEHNDEQKEKESPYNYEYIVLNDDRNILYNRIDKRVDMMFAAGMLAEMKYLIDRGLKKENISMQGIGYKEMFDYFDGVYDLSTAIEMIKNDTRHFAKRQITWFKREKEVDWFNYQDYDNSKEKILEAILKELERKNII